jgi:hypothetical protein
MQFYVRRENDEKRKKMRSCRILKFINKTDSKLDYPFWVLELLKAGLFLNNDRPTGEIENRHFYNIIAKLIAKNIVSDRVVDHQCIYRNRNKRLGYK